MNGTTYSAKTWVITTGSSPAIPKLDGLDKTPYITNKDIFSLDHLPKSMIVLGAGPIASEMAQAFARLGTKVSVIQRSDQILSKEDKDMADQVMNVMSAEGVDFYLETTLVSVTDLETNEKWSSPSMQPMKRNVSQQKRSWSPSEGLLIWMG